MTEQTEALIISSINNTREEFLRSLRELRECIEKEGVQRSKMFSDWGNVVNAQGATINEIEKWRSGHHEVFESMKKNIDSISQTVVKLAAQVEDMSEWQSNIKVKITLIASTISGVFGLMFAVLSLIL
jgi:uncharacterized coiled-coil DUF342 family protein